MLFLGILVALLVSFASPIASAGPVKSLQLDPTQLITHDDRPILFTAEYDPAFGPAPKVLTLVQVDEACQEVKYRWKLLDSGTLGDKLAGDGIYSRRVYFKERKPDTLHFTVPIPSNDPGLGGGMCGPPAMDQEHVVSLTITQRPTFVELMQRVWDRLVN